MKMLFLFDYIFRMSQFSFLVLFGYYFIFAEFGGFGSVGGRIEIDIKINHEGEVNR